MTETSHKEALIQVRVTPREKQRWHEAARREDMTMAELVRESVRARIADAARLGLGHEEQRRRALRAAILESGGEGQDMELAEAEVRAALKDLG